MEDFEIYDPLDLSLERGGPVEVYLRDPRVIEVRTSTLPFNRARGRQQTWRFPKGTGDVVAKRLQPSADGKTAKLVEYFIDGFDGEVENIQSNPSADGFVAKYAPYPLRDLGPDETILLIKINMGGIGLAPEWWVRVGQRTLPAPSPAGGSFTDDDRTDLKAVKADLRTVKLMLSRMQPGG